MINSVEQGFDFLGFNVRRYGEAVLIKPAKKNVKSFMGRIRKKIKARKGERIMTKRAVGIDGELSAGSLPMKKLEFLRA